MGGEGRLEERIPARLSPKEGRKFGFTVGIAFLVLTAISWWRGHEIAPYVLGGAGALLVLAGALVPGRLGPIQRGWMGLAHAISKVTTPIFLGIVYFVIIMPVGLLMRLMGRNPIRHAPKDGGYWAARGQARGSLTNQF
jgi:hypothetical protein